MHPELFIALKLKNSMSVPPYILGRRLADQSFKFRSGRIQRVSTSEDESAQNDGSSMASLGSGDASYNDGVYSGTGSGGMGGDVKVEVTIENGKLVSITYTDNAASSVDQKFI